MIICIVDYGLGNVGSIASAFRRLGVRVVLSSAGSDLETADGLVLPGVGSFPAAMKQIRLRALDQTLVELAVHRRKPLLGICLGMQILADRGEEFVDCEGLGLIPGTVKKLERRTDRKIPNVGWSSVTAFSAGDTMFSRSAPGDTFYFDHSFYFSTHPDYLAAAATRDEDIVAAVVRGNIWGVQFHPEKSQNAGLRLLKAFCMAAEESTTI